MDSVQASYNLSTGFKPVLQSNTQCLPPLPVVRKRVLPLEEITNNYHQLQKSSRQVQEQPQDRSYLHHRKKSRAVGKMAVSHAFAWEDLVPYHQYRQRQHRGNNTTEGDSVWDEETENAFMDGLREVPRLGRRKLTVKGKPCGRNELIAAYIFKRTGKHRTRKQVSSHIQVLKNLLKNNEEFMSLVSADEQMTPWDVDDLSSLSDSKTHTTNRLSTSTLGSQSSDSPNYHHVPDPYDPNTYISHAMVPARQTYVKPANFSMWVAATDVGCLHTYTQFSTDDPMTSPSMFPLANSWEIRFPYVTKLRRESPITTPIIHMNATIATMNVLPSSSSMFCTRVELLVSSDMYPNHDFQCVTRIYSSHKRVFKLASNVDCSSEKAESGFQKINLPFASEFFAAFFTKLVKIQGERPDTQDARKGKEQARMLIRELTVVQELFATPRIANGKKERAALFLWEFTKAQDGQQGGAIWRDVSTHSASSHGTAQAQSMARLNFDSIPEYQAPNMQCNIPISEWNNPYANYETNIEDPYRPPSAQLQYVPFDTLSQSSLAMQPRNYGLNTQPAELDDIHLQYLQTYQQYPGLSFTSTTADSSDYLGQWQPYPVLSSQDHLNESLEL